MPSLFRFDDFELDAQRFELRHLGSAIPAQPKVLRVLLHLVANRERSVTTAELLELVWPGEAVTTASVKRAIVGARRALGESGKSESSIRTVRGHGYRFVRAVQDAEPGATHAEAPGPVGPRAAASASTCEGLILSQHVRSTVERWLADLQSGSSSQLLFRGEPGTGKTAFLRQLAARAEAQGAAVLWFRCTAGASLASAMLQSLGEALSPCPAASDQRWFVSLLQAAAATRPVVALLDDLQDADPATLELIAALPRRLEGARVAFAGAIRPPMHDEPRAASLVRQATAALSARTIELAPFSDDELSRFTCERLGLANAVTRMAMREWTAGNPQLCESVAQWVTELPERDRAWWLARAACAQSASVQAAVDRQLSGLPAEARSLLQTAALFEQDFRVAALAQAGAIHPDEVRAHISDAVSQGTLRPNDADPTRFSFKSALVREALRAQMSLAEQARRHHAIGSALEASTPDAFGGLAHHFLHARADDAARALRYSSLAARELMRAGKHEAAMSQLEVALEVTSAHPSCARERLTVMLDRVDAFVSLGAFDRALEAATIAARQAQDAGDIDAMIRAAKMLARFPPPTRIPEPHLALMRDALAALRDGDPRAPGLEALLARAQVWSRCPEGRGERANAALASARKLEDAALRGDVLVDCLYALADPEFLPERLAIAEELESIGHQHDKRRLLVASAAARVWAYAELGDMREVDAYVSTLEVLGDHVRDPNIQWQAKVYRAMHMIVGGQLEDAVRLSTEALEIGKAIGLDYAPRAYCAQVGGVWRLQGRLKEAADLVRDSSLRHPAIAGWQAALAGIEAELGRVQHGREVLRRLLDHDLASLYGDPYGLGALAPAADLCAQVGDASQAKLLYDAISPYAGRHGIVAMGINTHGPLSRHLGRLALRMNDAARAERHFERAIEASEQSASPVFTSLSCLGYAEVLVASDRQGAVETAGLLTARAFQLAHEHGMWNVVERAKALAKRCAFRYGRSGLAAKRTAQTR